jgi:hypothetical protein
LISRREPDSRARLSDRAAAVQHELPRPLSGAARTCSTGLGLALLTDSGAPLKPAPSFAHHIFRFGGWLKDVRSPVIRSVIGP